MHFLGIVYAVRTPGNHVEVSVFLGREEVNGI